MSRQNRGVHHFELCLCSEPSTITVPYTTSQSNEQILNPQVLKEHLQTRVSTIPREHPGPQGFLCMIRTWTMMTIRLTEQ
jgi:hypothetical protein